MTKIKITNILNMNIMKN